MTFTWTGNVDHVTDENIAEIVADMRANKLSLTWPDVVKHLDRIDPEGTLNISATEFLERAGAMKL